MVIALIVLTPPVLTWGFFVYKWTFDGTYTRWAAEQEEREKKQREVQTGP